MERIIDDVREDRPRVIQSMVTDVDHADIHRNRLRE